MISAVVDIETTGLNHKKDDIIEIAAISFKGHKILDIFHSYINIDKEIPQTAINIHKITNKMLKGFPYFSDIVYDLNKFLKDKQLYAYNSNFEKRFLNSCKGLKITKIFDILSYVKKVQPSLSSYSLKHVCNYYQIPLKPHGAINDALACYWLVNILFK